MTPGYAEADRSKIGSPATRAKSGRSRHRARLLSALFIAACWCTSGWAAEQTNSNKYPNIFVFLIDTLRADHLSAYGYDRPTSRNLEALAREGTTFTNMRSVVSWTLPAVGSLFTSNYPTAHGLRANNTQRKVRSLRPGVVTLTQALKQMDYYTILITGNIWLKLEDRTGIERDFDRYEVYNNGTAAKVNERARALIEWVQRAPAHKHKPLFVYLHYQEPHGPWYAPRLDPTVLGPVTAAPDHTFTEQEAYANRLWLEFPPAKEERWKTALHVRDYVNAYDETVYSWDKAFGEFTTWLKGKNLYNDAIIAVVADHGEELWDHKGFGHGFSLYEEAVRIPFVFRPPGGSKQRKIDAMVNLLDVAPTILAAAGLPKPPSMQGRDVRNGVEPRPLFAEVDACRGDWGSCTQRVVWKGKRKLYLTCAKDCSQGRSVRLYDLAADPGEKAGKRQESAELQGLLRHWESDVSSLAKQFGESRTGQIDESVAERLRVLGY